MSASRMCWLYQNYESSCMRTMSVLKYDRPTVQVVYTEAVKMCSLMSPSRFAIYLWKILAMRLVAQIGTGGEIRILFSEKSNHFSELVWIELAFA